CVYPLIWDIALHSGDNAELDLYIWRHRVGERIKETSGSQESCKKRLQRHADIKKWIREYHKCRAKILRTRTGNVRIQNGVNTERNLPAANDVRKTLISEMTQMVDHCLSWTPDSGEPPPFYLVNGAAGLGKGVARDTALSYTRIAGRIV